MKHKNEDPPHIDETWLIPYSDLMTLLLALFIILFASSSVDQAKMSDMEMAFYQEYNGMLPEARVGEVGMGGISPGSAILPGQASGGDDPETMVDFFATNAPNDNPPGNSEDGLTFYNFVPELQENFTEYIEANGLEEEMQIEATADGLLVTLTSDVWFPSGSADINGPQKEIAAQISEMIAGVQDESGSKLSVVVSGHTDNVPMSDTSVYENNWQLSVARAVNFMEELMNTSTLEPSNFSARGFGEFEPIDTNDTAEGRQRNRRVEVMISPGSDNPPPVDAG